MHFKFKDFRFIIHWTPNSITQQGSKLNQLRDLGTRYYFQTNLIDEIIITILIIY
jgi:hypothetical protein